MHIICMCYIFLFSLNLINIIQRMYNEVAGGVATKILWTECAVLFVRWSPNNKFASRHLRPSFESGHQYPVSGKPAQTQGELCLMAVGRDIHYLGIYFQYTKREAKNTLEVYQKTVR